MAPTGSPTYCNSTGPSGTRLCIASMPGVIYLAPNWWPRLAPRYRSGCPPLVSCTMARRPTAGALGGPIIVAVGRTARPLGDQPPQWRQRHCPVASDPSLGRPGLVGDSALGAPHWVLDVNNGQTDALILAGLLLVNGFDLLILIIKPQVAFGVIISRVRRAGRAWPVYLAPPAIGGVVSLIIWPAWPLELAKFGSVLIPTSWNSSLWPYSVPVGMVLLVLAWCRGSDSLAIIATPLLFPYINAPSYLGLLAVFAARQPRWLVWVWLLSLALRGWWWAATSGVPRLALTLGGALLVIVAAAGTVRLGVTDLQRARQRRLVVATEEA
jgi:hypothetical protein